MSTLWTQRNDGAAEAIEGGQNGAGTLEVALVSGFVRQVMLEEREIDGVGQLPENLRRFAGCSPGKIEAPSIGEGAVDVIGQPAPGTRIVEGAQADPRRSHRHRGRGRPKPASSRGRNRHVEGRGCWPE